MTNSRKAVSKELETKAMNLGSILKERKITLDGITGDSILTDIESIRSQSEELQKKEREILDFKEQLKTKRENLFNSYHSVKSYIVSRARTEPELKGLLSSIKISKKRKKKEDSEPVAA